MARTVRRLPIHRLAALGLLALAPAAHAAPLRSYAVAQLDATANPGLGLDNDGHVVDQPIRTIVGTAPTFDLGYNGGWDARLPGRGIKWAEVKDGTPDGQFLIVTGGLGSYPYRDIIQTFIANPNYPFTPDGWYARTLEDDYWTSIRGIDVNASGEIVGQLARIIKDGPNGVEWDHNSFFAAAGDSTVHKLIELFPPGSGWSSVGAVSINDSGQILGWGTNPEGEYAKFLLTPTTVPEPGTWAVFGLTAAALGLHARLRSG